MTPMRKVKGFMLIKLLVAYKERTGRNRGVGLRTIEGVFHGKVTYDDNIRIGEERKAQDF
jgi:hypothetical protein